MNHEPNLLPEQCQPEELIVFLSLRPRYLNGRENVTSDIVTSQVLPQFFFRQYNPRPQRMMSNSDAIASISINQTNMLN
jgi:hypothetical protein